MSKQAATGCSEKEYKKLKKWKRMLSSTESKRYFLLLMIIVSLIYIIDEVSTNINNSMQSLVLFDLFHIESRDVTSPEYAAALTQIGLLGMVTLLFNFLMPIYKSLADRYGRKLFLLINTAGMGLGMLLVMLAKNLGMYMIGVAVLAFVTPNDIHTMYIMETAPIKHRAKLCNIIKAIGILGISSIGILRHIFVTDDISSWRIVYLFPVIASVLVVLVGIFTVRESPAFIHDRISRLETNAQVKEDSSKPIEKNADSANGGFIKAVRFICRHRQLRNIALCGIVFIITTVVTGYYESIMAATMSPAQIATAIFCYPFSYAVITVISGIFSDRLGRKRVCQIFGCLATVALLLFVLASKYIGNGVLCGLLYGMFVGGLWSTSDTLFFMCAQESAPTNLRASVVGAMSLVAFGGSLLGGIVFVFLQNFIDLGWLCLGFTVPFMAAALILISKRIGETKEIDLETVTGCEWD